MDTKKRRPKGAVIAGRWALDAGAGSWKPKKGRPKAPIKQLRAKS